MITATAQLGGTISVDAALVGNLCPPATFTLINTATPPATLDSGSIPSGGDLPIIAPPATVRLVDTDDNELLQDSVPSGVMTDVTAPDATLKLNNSLTTYPIRSGELYNMLVRLNGQVPQTFSYTPGTKTLDVISPPCADGTVDINGDQVATVASGGLVNIMVEQDGNPVGAFDPNSNSWVIPSCPQDLTLRVQVATGADTFTFTLTANEAGTITSVNAGGLTTFVLTVNANPVTAPFSIANGDVLAATFDTAGADTAVTLTGTY
jgi:hypothetical protein